MDAVFTLWLRQVKKYGRSRSRIVGALGQPLLFMVALGFGFGPIYAQAGSGNYMQFLAPGIIAMSILFTSIFSGIEVIWDRQFGFLKETLVAPVSRYEIMLGRTLGGATAGLFQGVIVFFIALAFGMQPDFALVPAALLIAALVAVFFTALGTAIASKMDDMQGFQLIMNFVVMPIFFLSGALFPIDGLPSGIREATYINPLSYGVDGLRAALGGASHFGLGYDLVVLTALTAACLAVGSYLFSKIQA